MNQLKLNEKIIDLNWFFVALIGFYFESFVFSPIWFIKIFWWSFYFFYVLNRFIQKKENPVKIEQKITNYYLVAQHVVVSSTTGYRLIVGVDMYSLNNKDHPNNASLTIQNDRCRNVSAGCACVCHVTYTFFAEFSKRQLLSFETWITCDQINSAIVFNLYFICQEFFSIIWYKEKK